MYGQPNTSTDQTQRHRTLGLVAALFCAALLAGCSYGSKHWNKDMPLEQKTTVAATHFHVSDSVKDVESHLDDLRVRWSNVTEWPHSAGGDWGHEREYSPRGRVLLVAYLEHEGANFITTMQNCEFYFDDANTLSEIWIPRFDLRRTTVSGRYQWIDDHKEAIQFPIRAVPPPSN